MRLSKAWTGSSWTHDSTCEAIKCQTHRAVAQAFTDDFQLRSFAEEESGVGVAAIVEAYFRQPGTAQERLK